MPALELDDVALRFPDGAEALRGVSLTVAPGEVVTVVGPSGAGKTSLLRVVCGLATATRGRVLLGGQDLVTTPPERRPVAMVFQGFALFPHLTARANIAFGPRVRRERDIDATVDAVAERLGITDLLDRLPAALSGGERQRVALARCLVRRPAVFCLDEPLSSLDPVLRAEARLLLAEVLRAEDRCALLVTHDQVEAMTMGDRVAVLRDGALEQLDPPDVVYARPASPFVAGFVGDPPMSLLRAPVPFLRGVPEGVVVGVRAEHVSLTAGDDATVLAVEHRGHEVHVVADAGGQRVSARLGSTELRPGDRVGVVVDHAHLRVFTT